MSFYQILQVEGGSGGRVLCYGMFPFIDGDVAYERAAEVAVVLGCEVFKFCFEEQGSCLVMFEAVLSDGEIGSFVISALDEFFALGHCLGAFCLFDGAFVDYSDIFNGDVSGQMYALCLEQGGGVVNMDVTFLRSTAWAEIVAVFQDRLARGLSDYLVGPEPRS